MLLYSGQFDINVGGPGTEKYLRTLEWPGLQQWHEADRHVWMVEDNVAGYVKQVKPLTFVNVNNAGYVKSRVTSSSSSLPLLLLLIPSAISIHAVHRHMVPATQPENALDMITRWIRDEPFF